MFEIAPDFDFNVIRSGQDLFDVMKDMTERPEVLAAGTVILVGASRENIVDAVKY